MRIIFIILLFFSFTANGQFYLLNQTAAAPGGYDADAQDYIDRVVSAGGTLSTPLQDSINAFVVREKAEGRWSGLIDAWPLLGGTAAAHSESLKGLADVTWVNSPTHSASGVAFNGSTQYGQSNFIPSVHMDLVSSSYSYYSQTNNTNTGYALGANQSNNQRVLLRPYNAGSFQFDLYTFAARSTATNTNTAGFYVASKESLGILRSYENGVLLNSNTGIQSGASLPSVQVYFGAYNNSGTPTGYTNRTFSFFSAGVGWDATQIAAFSTSVNNLMTGAGRNTY